MLFRSVIRSAAGFHLLRLNDQRQVAPVADPPVAQWCARHILFRVSESLPEAEATRRAQDMVTRLKAGEDFAELAKKHSADGSAAKGGDLGWLLPGDTVPEFERAMSRLEAKEVSDPVRSPFGIHVIQVLEKRTEKGDDIVSGVGTKNITFTNAFYDIPTIIITGQNMATGDYFVITSKAKTGFSITFYNSSNTIISRTFDYQVIGYGLKN